MDNRIYGNSYYNQQQQNPTSHITIPYAQYADMMNGVFQKQLILRSELDNEASLQQLKTSDKMSILDYQEKLYEARMLFNIELDASYYEVILKDDGPYSHKIVGGKIRSEVKLFTTHGLCSFFYTCKDGKEPPRILEITDILHDDPIILVDSRIDGKHLSQGLSRWGVYLNVSRRNKEEIIDKLLFVLAKESKEKVISRNYGWNRSKEGVWYFEHDIKNTLEEVLLHE